MTIRKHHRGRWMVDVKYKMPDGSIKRVRRVSPVPTRKGAHQFEREVRKSLANGTYGCEEEDIDEDKIPRFAEFADYFIETYAMTNNRPSTVREKRRALRRGLLEHLGHLRLDMIGPRQIESFKARRKKNGVGPKTINEELAILSKILGYAEEVGDLPKTPPKIRRLKVPPPSFDFLDFEEGARLVAAAEGAPEPWCAMIPLALWTGLRLGELRALHWDDIDLVAARLTVRHAADDCNELHPPKSGRARVVDLPRKAVALLRRHKHLRGLFVFCREDGSILPNWECESRSKGRPTGPLARVCRKASLRPIGWHVLRHSYASQLVMSGANLLEVKELLGHSSLTMTMRYAHLSPDARKAAVALLDGAPKGLHRGTGNAQNSQHIEITD